MYWVACAAPMYGTCSSLWLVDRSNSSPIRNGLLLSPNDPYDTLPGALRAASATSATLWYGLLAGTTMTYGNETICEMGVKSPIGSSGKFFLRLGDTVCTVADISRSEEHKSELQSLMHI